MTDPVERVARAIEFEITCPKTAMTPDEIFATAARAAIAAMPASSADLQRVADVIEPHWRGAGVELTADWVIAEYISLGNELEETRAQLETSPATDAVREAALLKRINGLPHGWLPEVGYVKSVTLNAAEEQLVLAALSHPSQGGWQPIETAPKDGTRILVVCDGDTRVAAWGKTSHVPMYGFCLADQGEEEFDLVTVDLWQPLPAPPEVQP